MLVDLPVLTPAEADDLAERIEAVRADWLVRSYGFATLGVATYLDLMPSSRPEETYYGRLAAWNAFLAEHFGDVFDRVRRALSEWLAAPTRLEAAVAHPGFHVFEHVGVCTADQPAYHFDLQHRYLRWPFGPVSDDVISFTLAVKLPRLGGGLDVWDFTEADFVRLGRLGRQHTMPQIAHLKPMRTHRYRPGVMAVQARPIMHRIAAVKEHYDDDQRITLQGHGVRDGATWVLYW